ncbi:uncharacterized protein LOC121432100 [Lytechinus variegatus]|uniref:uncharacterized protein LOC121432100 n=1 Tax=Lytechinus variegatus TaxID=7654 RepID=UPI001BB2A342|nr:uncharacterized protein LOC121432100 [Lytechinus variegatus]
MMELNTNKCEVITVTRKRNRIVHQYKLKDAILTPVEATKYLGVTITSDLKWNSHISNVCQKANNTLAFLRRNLRVNSPKLKATAYQSLVRPLVEYASTVWDPSTSKNIYKLEMIQRRAARFTLNRYHNTSSVSSMLQELGWTSLQQRQEISRLVMFYKIHNELVPFNSDAYITKCTRSTRAVHTQGYLMPQSRTQQHQCSFFPRTIKMWNTLPVNVVTAPSTEAFRLQLTKGNNS